MDTKEDPVWGTVTLAMPQVVQWQVERGGICKQGERLQRFAEVMAGAGRKGQETTLRLSILVRS